MLCGADRAWTLGSEPRRQSTDRKRRKEMVSIYYFLGAAFYAAGILYYAIYIRRDRGGK